MAADENLFEIPVPEEEKTVHEFYVQVIGDKGHVSYQAEVVEKDHRLSEKARAEEIARVFRVAAKTLEERAAQIEADPKRIKAL